MLGIEIQPQIDSLSPIPMPVTDAKIERIALRVKWWEPAEETLSDRDDFLCRVMNLGTWNDIEYVDHVFGEEAFRHAIDHCRPGVMDRRSWHYWHIRLGMGSIPPMPQRTFA
jgi:hypothetical protein